MGASFTLEEILQATSGLLRGEPVAGFASVSTDTRSIGPGALFVALVGERFDAHDFVAKAAEAGAVGAVVRKGAKIAAPEGFCLIEVDDTLRALGALARFHRRRFRIPIGGLGGSNGKTTTKEMIGAILEARGPALKTEGNLNNEIGVPLTLFRLEPRHTAAILEMGMNRPGELERISRIAEADCAGITNVGPEHLEHLGSLEGVAEAEGEIYAGVKPDGIAVANADDALVMEQARRSGRRLLTFGRAASADVRLLEIVSHDLDGLRIRIGHAGREFVCTLRFVGEHNALNACCAFAMGIALGCSPEQCLTGLETARPYRHRLEIYRDASGLGPTVTVIDDCYNANPASMEAALDTVGALAGAFRKVAVLGDMLEVGATEEAEHRALGDAAAKAGFELLVAVGPRSRFTYEGASALGANRLHLAEPADVAPAIDFLKSHLKENDVVVVKGSRGMRLERVVDALLGPARQVEGAR